MDLFANPEERDPPNEFVKLLWERGLRHEKGVVHAIGVDVVDASGGTADERLAMTLVAMDAKAPLIYGGRIVADDLVGEPDLLRLEHDGYIAGDIKSGAAEEGDEARKAPKVHYAVQVALYTDILQRQGRTAALRAFIIDREGVEVTYDLDLPQGGRKPRRLWDEYRVALANAQAIVAKSLDTKLALGGHCALCHWNTRCKASARADDDLTLIPEVGRSKRDALLEGFTTVSALAACNPEDHIKGSKTSFAGIGADTLRKFARRAQLLKRPEQGAYLTEEVNLPEGEVEIFFDIEDDPFTGLCYLHGFLERTPSSELEHYTGFYIAKANADGERDLFMQAIDYLRARPNRVLYYYSPHERTVWRGLQKRHPEVASAVEIEALFDETRAVDLYLRVVRAKTEWPTNSYSIKAIATHLNFSWRDENPSGMASIEWFTRWIETEDETQKARLLAYNEDDCRAMRVLLDAVRRLPVRE